MSQNKKIILKKNSTFKASDITISGLQWGGFNFDNTGIGTADRAGCVVISNSNISGAHLVFNATSGGGIRSSYNVFYNNEKILNAYYHIYNTGIYDLCFFRGCTFYNTGCVGQSTTWFTINNIENIRFSGCKFLNICSSVTTAIQATHSKISITDRINSLGNSVHSVFSGFPASNNKSGGAINIVNNQSNSTDHVVITYCDFIPYTYNNYNYITNQKAITLKGCTNAEVYANTIIIDDNYSNYEKHGIYLDDCSGFTMENNNITAIQNSNSSVSSKTYGIIIQNSGIATNQIYRNTLTNCEFGIRAQGENRGNANYYYKPNQGLKFLCNDFNSYNTAYYMSAIPTSNSQINNSVSKFQQGALSTSATDASPNFNQITDRSLVNGSDHDFYVEGTLSGFDINYIEPTNPATYELHYYSNNTISRGTDQLTSSNTPHCESRLPCRGMNCAVLMNPQPIGVYEPSFLTLKTQLKELVNAGDHDYLYNLVLNVSSSNLFDVYNELLRSTPSHDILALACGNDIFTTAMVEDILVTNSYGIKSNDVRTALNRRQEKLTQPQLDNIYTAAESLSEYEQLMMQVDNINTEYMRLMNSSLNVLYNRDIIPMDSVRQYLTSIGDFISTIQLIEIEFTERDLDAAQSLFNSISTTTNEQDEIDDYSNLYNNVLFDIYENHDGEFAAMSTTQIAVLNGLKDQESYASGISKSLLSQYADYNWIDTYYPITSKNNARRANSEIISNSTVGIKYYPNPAKNSLTVIMPDNAISDVQLLITDVSGRIVLNQIITQEKSLLNISNLSNGIYLIRTVINNDVKISKLIINK